MGEPPVAVKEAIEKTVQYVKKNGVSFEAKLIENDKDGKFSFLQASNPYHSYYKQKLEHKPEVPQDGNVQIKESEPEKPRELLFLTDLPPVSNIDNEIIKSCALYIACNSDKHIEALRRHMERKGKRNQFAFLNRNHTLHLLFQSYVKQYTVIIETAKKEGEKALEMDKLLHSNSHDFFERAYSRAAYEKKHRIETRARQEETKQKQLRFASIDWQDFSLVAKVGFSTIDEVSELALPISREEIMYRSLNSRSKELELRYEEKKEEKESKETQENKEEQDESKENQKESKEDEEEKPKEHKIPKGMKIRAAGESRLKKKKAAERTIQCPITGKQIAELQFDTHLRVLLRDPSYKEQQENFVKKNFTYSSNLTTDQVYENIKRLVHKRALSEEEEQAGTKRVALGPQ